MEKCGNPGALRGAWGSAVAACSGCAGDYEDPDRTAWTDDQLDEPMDDDQGDALSAKSTMKIERNSNGAKAIDEIAGRRNENENENHRDA